MSVAGMKPGDVDLDLDFLWYKPNSAFAILNTTA
jgi:hypothetical protein